MFAVKVCKVNCVKHLYLYEKHATLFCAKHNFLWLVTINLKKLFRIYRFFLENTSKKRKKIWPAMKRKEKIITKKIHKLTGRLYQRNCLTFGSLRCSNKEPGLKIFFHDIIKINILGS